ncbi:hypothetical protein N0V84_011390 [Fusarium piperis]|uniref:Mitochondrial inner membrane protein 1 n=1 Tax=Fusarium piperis TaxID=1435070 RepID=A0A9W8W4B8_9HYPO|nr:hypothetical protein N0V84_011390 [Fusarium piperis]
MFRTYSRSLWHLASRSSPNTTKLTAQTSPRFTIAPLLRQPARIAFSSKSNNENKDPPPPYQTIDREAERKRGQEMLGSDPSKVSTQSSVRHVIEEPQGPASGEHDMAGELKHDINIVKDTFRFKSVPRESHILGLAGTLPYMGTSLSTVFLAWDLNKQWPTGNAFYDTIFVDHETAKYLLSVIEPLQLGYGAVIISFLGAIHWVSVRGLEYAEKQPLRERTRFRYGMGLAASIIAWPTLFLPVEYALTTQFMAFVALYFADSRAATRGWAPQWYGTYRFLLTAMVGLAIFISLVGRAKIRQGDSLSGHGLSDNFSRSGIADNKTNWTKLEEEEKERVKKEKKKKAKEAEKKKQEETQEKMKSEKGHEEAKTEVEDSDKGEEQSKNDKDNDQGNEVSKDQEKGSDKESKDNGKDKKEGNDESKGEGKDGKDESGGGEPKDEGSKEQGAKSESGKK